MNSGTEGLKNYRQSQIQKNLQVRARVIQTVRNFFIDREYLEVETPIRIPAPAPEAHIDAVGTGDWFLQTSPELCMKTLLAAGFQRIFQICKCFRNKERGARHLPELTMLEWYSAGGNYFDLMVECEDLIRSIVRDLSGSDKISYQGRQILLNKPWQRLPVAEAFIQYAAMPMENALAEDCFDEVMVDKIEPKLGSPQPTFLYDYPAPCGALARLKPDNRLLAERFELYIAGVEMCNGFSELTDPLEQRKRFGKEQQLRISFNKTAYPIPEKFLLALSNMPNACGNALGIDRLVMLLADAKTIDDVVAFTPEEL
jgi:lysyl-tRNA synthetase class 2